MDTNKKNIENCCKETNNTVTQSSEPLFTGKVAVVTGGSRGIGKAVALNLSQKGAAVALLARNLATCRQAAAQIEERGGRALAFSVHIENLPEVERAVREVIAHFGRLDFLINNAGVNRDALILRMGKEDWDTVLEVNLTGAFNCIKSAVRQLTKQRQGKIINISSIVGLTGNPGQANYAASKAGLIGLTKTLARELAGRGITVNAVAPGFIETDMTDKLPRKVKDDLLNRIPLRRFGQPEEVAQAVSYLLSPAGHRRRHAHIGR